MLFLARNLVLYLEGLANGDIAKLGLVIWINYHSKKNLGNRSKYIYSLEVLYYIQNIKRCLLLICYVIIDIFILFGEQRIINSGHDISF